MSFWNHFGFTSSPIDGLLEKPDTTLERLMDEPDLIQECKSQNRKLIDFCIQKDTLEKIVNYVVDCPPEDADEKRKIKYPQLCTDILCAEVWQFSDAIYGNTELLKKLYAFFERDPNEMNEEEQKVAGNCVKAITCLLHRKSSETLKFLREYPKIVEHFVDHVRNPAISDYIQHLIGDEEHSFIDDSLGDTQPLNEDAGTVKWLCEQKFVDLLMDKFVNCPDEETQQCVGQMLFDLAQLLSSDPPSPIIERLESIELVDKMFNYITNIDTIKNRRSLSLSGFSILIELLRKKRVSEYQDILDPESLPSLVVAVSSHLKDCKTFLETAETVYPIRLETTYGLLEPPLGLARQSVLELVESLALTNSAYVFKALYDSRFMETAVDIFFKYPWNNFAHQSVFNIIATVLPEPYKELSQHIMRDCKLIERILAAEKDNKKKFAETNTALGYIGHLTKISSLINGLADRERQNDDLEGIFVTEVKEYPDWEEYLIDTLKDRNDLESIPLGGNRPGVYGLDQNQWVHDDDDSDSDGDDGEVVIGGGDDDDDYEEYDDEVDKYEGDNNGEEEEGGEEEEEEEEEAYANRLEGDEEEEEKGEEEEVMEEVKEEEEEIKEDDKEEEAKEEDGEKEEVKEEEKKEGGEEEKKDEEKKEEEKEAEPADAQ